MFIDDAEANKPDNETRMGGCISLFGRVNIKKHYLQLEAGNSFIRDIVIWDLNDFGYSSHKNINSKNLAITFDLPLIYGYNFVKKDKYELSLFAGPKMRYTYYNKEQISNSQDIKFNIKEDVNPFTASCIIGMGAKYRDFLLISDMSLQSPFTTNPEHILYTKMIHLSPKELFMLKEV